MTRLIVERAGPATSVQDFGRTGMQRYGLGTAGAMDRLSLCAANALAGNAPDAPAVEVGPLTAHFAAAGGALRVALCGAARAAAIAGRPLAMNETAVIEDGETLTLGVTRDGSFTYLAIEGAIAAAPVMGSLSTHARLGLGSPYPRPLMAGDVLPVAPARPRDGERRIAVPWPRPGAIRVVPGPQADYFDAAATALFFATEWRVSAVSDRMGYRLDGPAIAHARGHNIVSDGIAAGAIQVPGSGLPLVLLADRGTTGGYPKIATVITADLGAMAQTPVGRPVRFEAVSIEAAQAEARAFALLMAGLPQRVSRRHAPLTQDALLAANVAGDATDALASLPGPAD